MKTAFALTILASVLAAAVSAADQHVSSIEKRNLRVQDKNQNQNHRILHRNIPIFIESTIVLGFDPDYLSVVDATDEEIETAVSEIASALMSYNITNVGTFTCQLQLDEHTFQGVEVGSQDSAQNWVTVDVDWLFSSNGWCRTGPDVRRGLMNQNFGKVVQDLKQQFPNNQAIQAWNLMAYGCERDVECPIGDNVEVTRLQQIGNWAILPVSFGLMLIDKLPGVSIAPLF